MVRQWQTLFYDRHYAGTSLNMRRCDYVALASAYGAQGKRVETLGQLKAAFDEAFASDEVYLIDCVIDSDELVLPMMQPNGSLQDIMERV
jgi:acetolactate synthase-1/2/3 large subunit